MLCDIIGAAGAAGIAAGTAAGSAIQITASSFTFVGMSDD
jgi:hypothetical protein